MILFYTVFNRARNKRTRIHARAREGLEMPCVALWGVLRAFWVCRRVGYSREDANARGGALKCDYGDLILFRGVDQGQKKRQLQRQEYR